MTLQFKEGTWPQWVFVDGIKEIAYKDMYGGPPRITYYNTQFGKMALKEKWHAKFLGVKFYSWSKQE